MKSFAGKVAAITGAGSGIGRALALTLAKQKCDLALSDINEVGVQKTAADARALGVKVTAQRLDVADRAAMYAWAQQVVADHGRVNLIFNNAGVALGGTVAGVTYDDFEWIMGINFWGVVYGTKAFLPHLHASGDGHVINVSSVFGLFAVPTQSAYNASKFAVRGFTEALRQELELSGAPVSATSVHPGGIKTNIARDARLSKDIQSIPGAEKLNRDFEKLFITPPEKAAEVILAGVRRNRRRVLIGPDAKFLDWMVRLLPSVYQRLVMSATAKQAGSQLKTLQESGDDVRFV